MLSAALIVLFLHAAGAGDIHHDERNLAVDDPLCEDPIAPGGLSLRMFPLEDTLQHLFPPQNVPEHLKYTLHLDQAGAINTDNGLVNEFPTILFDGIPIGGDVGGAPESAIVFPDSTNRIVEVDRCHGGWLYFYSDVTEINSKPLSFSGLDFFDVVSSNGGVFCNLTLVWNRDFTKFEINKYFDSFVGKAAVGIMYDLITEISAILEPYWAWKFGLPIPRRNQLSEEEYNELDQICCPGTTMDDAATTTNPCWGEATLGIAGSECETISMACPEKVSIADARPCGMWKRINIGYLGYPNYGTYSIYPIGDKYGNPTPYFDNYVEILKNMSGVHEVFYGQDEPCE